MFNINEFEEQIISDIQEVFNLAYDELETEVEVSEEEKQEPTFPCVIVDILNPISAERHIDSGGTYNYIDFSINCDIYAQETEELSAKKFVQKLSQILIEGLTKKYNTLVVTRNKAVPSLYDETKRITTTFRGTLDKIENILYSN